MANALRSADEIVRRVITEQGLQERRKADPLGVLQEMAATAIRKIPRSRATSGSIALSSR